MASSTGLFQGGNDILLSMEQHLNTGHDTVIRVNFVHKMFVLEIFM